MNPYVKRKIIKKQKKSSEETDDYIAIEKRLRISINGREVISLYCTPLMIKELVIGLFLTEGVINRIPEEMNIVLRDEITVDIPIAGDVSTEGMVTSRCLGGVTFNKERTFEKIRDDFSLAVGTVKTILEEVQQKSELFSLTGCFHSAALSDGKGILVLAEDIGRHNAVDKVIGYCILNEIPFSGKLMVVSCRLSSEIVSKCARWSIPILASRAAPTDLAIEIGEQSGMTIIGFARGERMNIYTNQQRITK